MFSSRKKGKLAGKLFIVTIAALFIYGYILDDDSIDYFKNLYSKNETDLNETNENNNNDPETNAESNDSNSNKDIDPINPVDSHTNNIQYISSDTKLICKSYNNDNNQISTEELDIPENLVNLSIDEAKDYIAENHTNWIINDINEDYIEIFVTSQQESYSEPYYLIKENEGKIYIYEFDETGEQKMIQETNIHFELLSETDQEFFKDGIVKYDMDSVHEILQDFES